MWKKIQSVDELPRDRSFLVMWKDIPGLCQFQEKQDSKHFDRFFISFSPAKYMCATAINLNFHEEISRLTYWMDIPRCEEIKKSFLRKSFTKKFGIQ